MNLDKINCKKIFQKAYEKRYTWNEDFNGYKGQCSFLIDNHRYEGEFVLGKNFKPDIKKINDNKIVKLIGSQLFEVCIHRVKRKFESLHSENNFNFLKSSDMGIEMKISGKNGGDKYRVNVTVDVESVDGLKFNRSIEWYHFNGLDLNLSEQAESILSNDSLREVWINGTISAIEGWHFHDVSILDYGIFSPSSNSIVVKLNPSANIKSLI